VGYVSGTALASDPNSRTGAVTSTGGTVVINATNAADANYLSTTSPNFTITTGEGRAICPGSFPHHFGFYSARLTRDGEYGFRCATGAGHGLNRPRRGHSIH